MEVLHQGTQVSFNEDGLRATDRQKNEHMDVSV